VSSLVQLLGYFSLSSKAAIWDDESDPFMDILWLPFGSGWWDCWSLVVPQIDQFRLIDTWATRFQPNINHGQRLKLRGQNLGRVFNSRLYRGCVCCAIAYLTKWTSLKLKIQPKQLLGSLPLAFALPAYKIFFKHDFCFIVPFDVIQIFFNWNRHSFFGNLIGFIIR
jgi:hypothetical protein